LPALSVHPPEAPPLAPAEPDSCALVFQPLQRGHECRAVARGALFIRRKLHLEVQVERRSDRPDGAAIERLVLGGAGGPRKTVPFVHLDGGPVGNLSQRVVDRDGAGRRAVPIAIWFLVAGGALPKKCGGKPFFRPVVLFFGLASGKSMLARPEIGAQRTGQGGAREQWSPGTRVGEKRQVASGFWVLLFPSLVDVKRLGRHEGPFHPQDRSRYPCGTVPACIGLLRQVGFWRSCRNGFFHRWGRQVLCFCRGFSCAHGAQLTQGQTQP